MRDRVRAHRVRGRALRLGMIGLVVLLVAAPAMAATPEERSDASIDGRAWEDADRDGLQDTGEPGVPGLAVNLIVGSRRIAAGATDAGGTYTFTGLDAGTYRVEFVLPTDGEFTRRNAGEDDTLDSDPARSTGITSPITIGATDTTGHWDAGLLPGPTGGDAGGSIGDRVWEDQDGDGVQDPSEPGVGEVTIHLLAGSRRIATTTSDAAGHYDFTGLDAGRYRVEFVLPADREFTRRNAGGDDTLDSDPARSTGITSPITIGATDTTGHWDAGLKALPGAETGAVDLEARIATEPANGIVLGPGPDLLYRVTVINRGEADATNVVLLDLLPPRCSPGSTDPSGFLCPVAAEVDPPFASGPFSRFPMFTETADAVSDPSFRIDNPPPPPGAPAPADSERDVAQGGVVVDVTAPPGVSCVTDAAVHGVRCDIPHLPAGASASIEIQLDINSWVRGSVRNRAWVYTDDQTETNTIKVSGTPCGDTSQTLAGPPSDWRFPQPAGDGCNYAKD